MTTQMNTTDAESNWTKTPPTEPGFYYWRTDASSSWMIVLIHYEDDSLFASPLCDEWGEYEKGDGEWMRVPAPGTTFTIPEIGAWACEHNPDQINDPQEGLVATTARHRKLWG